MTTTAHRDLPVYHPTPPPRGDLTRAPILGRFLRWKHARTALQLPLLLLAAVIVADGFFGPDVAAQNAAGVAPWIQWRGLVVLALLVAGNLFCMACPFMLPRRLAKRWLPADRSWPSWLRTKWLALGLLVAFFWAYEAFDLWNSPWLTAWLVVSYFAAAFVIDGFFRGAAFCKHVCPIGSFNFVNSLASPGEVRVRDAAVCESCETKDCIAGRHAVDPRTGATREVQSGCELWLFQPRKAGNMDCTFCLDCVQACPYDNVGIVARVPGRELVRDPWRSGLGRFSERPDLVALALATVFLAFVNAAGMIAPMRTVERWIGGVLGTGNETAIWTVFLVVALGLVPAALVLAAGAAGRALARESVTLRTVVLRMSLGLVPLGFGMWLAHYAFHFLAGGLTVLPVLHRAAIDVGLLRGVPAGVDAPPRAGRPGSGGAGVHRPPPLHFPVHVPDPARCAPRLSALGAARGGPRARWGLDHEPADGHAGNGDAGDGDGARTGGGHERARASGRGHGRPGGDGRHGGPRAHGGRTGWVICRRSCSPGRSSRPSSSAWAWRPACTSAAGAGSGAGAGAAGS
jgi:polyferredoxin